MPIASGLRWVGWALIASAVACGTDADAAPSSWVRVEQSTTAQAEAKARAVAAKDALATKLMGELSAALVSGGPAHGIEVCSQRAMRIAQQVSAEQNVRIGRTAKRLRQPDNQAPSWAKAWVERDRADPESAQPVLFAHGSTLGALFPIRLQPQCTQCHGKPDQVEPLVREALARLYPEDRATGFRAGDLRGWFWVEVDS